MYFSCIEVFRLEISLTGDLRSNHRRCSVKKGFLRNFVKFTGKTCARVSFLLKLQASDLQLYLKRDSGTGVFL